MKIEAFNVKMKYPKCDVYAVDGASMEVSNKKFTILSGASGSGKTSLLSILSGLHKPTYGKVLVNSKDMYSMHPDELIAFRREFFGIVPQGNSLVSNMTADMNIHILSLFNKIKLDEDYIKELVRILDVEDLLNKMPSELSGGEARRISIIRALAHKPTIIFADEPTGDLDDANTEKVVNLLYDQASIGCGVFVVSHDSVFDKYADEMVYMDKGQLVFI